MTDIAEAVSALRQARERWRARQDEARDTASFPSPDAIDEIVILLAAALYPRRIGRFAGDAGGPEDRFVAIKLAASLTALEREIAAELGYWEKEASAPFPVDQAATITHLFAATLGDVRESIDGDIEAAFLNDPAARSVDEILLCYPGAIASLHHRIAHQLYLLGAPIVARIISERANERTGIDIHPGAKIGRSFFIDHGTGVVIGETAIIGDRVRLYQHVTLGARDTPDAKSNLAPRPLRRHPAVEDDVVIYAGTTILGPVTIGARSVLGGNVWLLSDVPADSVVVQPEARRLDVEAGLAMRTGLRAVA